MFVRQVDRNKKYQHGHPDRLKLSGSSLRAYYYYSQLSRNWSGHTGDWPGRFYQSSVVKMEADDVDWLWIGSIGMAHGAEYNRSQQRHRHWYEWNRRRLFR